jgi:hypothetical protein
MSADPCQPTTLAQAQRDLPPTHRIILVRRAVLLTPDTTSSPAATNGAATPNPRWRSGSQLPTIGAADPVDDLDTPDPRTSPPYLRVTEDSAVCGQRHYRLGENRP